MHKSSSLNSTDSSSTDKQLINLLHELRYLLYQQQSQMLNRWNRSLPFADYIVDRWQKAQELGFGEGSSIYDSSLVFGNVTVGKNTWIGPFTILDGSGGLSIGEHCSISAGVQIYSHDTVQRSLSGFACDSEYDAVSIGNCCYIGPNAIIGKGVNIGNGCIIGANSFVNRDIPSGMKAWGTPAQIVET